MVRKKTPFEKEWENLYKKEERFLKSREEKKDSILNQKLAEKVPDKLQDTLNAAFAKAFSLIFEKGTGIIEKTYNKDAMKIDYQIARYADEITQSSKSLHAFSKKAQGSGAKNLLLSGVSGIGLGVLGVGLPDIPLFTGMILKSIYETALHFGYEYESENERYFILLVIQGAVAYGGRLLEVNAKADRYITDQALPEGYCRAVEIRRTADMLSMELLYMKFLQSIPVVGAVGGAYDAIYMKRITEFANLKYGKRFLQDKRKTIDPSKPYGF